MRAFVEMHALRSFPPGNLNRDDLGSPKTAVFGGVRRLRVSSQCLKRTWRWSEYFRGAFAEDELGIRTSHLPAEVFAALDTSFDEGAREGLSALLQTIGRKEAKAAPAGEDDALSREKSEEEEPPEQTAHLLFLSRQEIESVVEFAKANKDALAKAVRAKKGATTAIESLRKALEKYLVEHTSENAVDVGLFGRFLTSNEFDTVEGALQVAHGLGTQKVEVEYDFFTAVDDLSEDPGAGHLGETEFASSVLYLYACCDLAQLEQNLGARSANGRAVDEEARTLARKSLPAVVRAMAEATPRGKQTGTAPHTPAEYVEVVVRHGTPLSFANAFSKPVDGREHASDVMAASIVRLAEHRDRIEKAYGRDRDVVARYILCLRDADAAAPAGSEVSTIGELDAKLADALKALP